MYGALGSEDLRSGSCTGLGSGSGSVGVLPDFLAGRARSRLGLTGAGAGAGAARAVSRGEVASSLRFGGILRYGTAPRLGCAYIK